MLELAATLGISAAADELGYKYQSLKNKLSRLYEYLEVDSLPAAIWAVFVEPNMVEE